MKYDFLPLAVLILATSCQIADHKSDAAKEIAEMNAIGVTVEPEPGTYPFRPWVKVTREGSKGSLYVKGPDDPELTMLGHYCSSSPYPNTTASSSCIQLKDSGSVEYNIQSGGVASNTTTLKYKVKLEQNDLDVESSTTAGTNGDSIKLSEVETFCKYDSRGEYLTVVVQTTNADKVTDKRYAYLFFKFKSPADGATMKVNLENDFEVGIVIKPTSDSVPTYISGAAYSSKPILSKDPAGSNIPEAVCEFKADKAERGKINKGTVSCQNLRSAMYSTPAVDKLLGEMISITGNWQCDTYKS